MTTRPIAFINARLVDPATGYDGPGALISSGGRIAEVSHEVGFADLSPDIRQVDCNGAMLAPGLVDLRVKTGEPGAEPKETLKSAARAAAAGGVTSIVVQPVLLHSFHFRCTPWFSASACNWFFTCVRIRTSL